MAAFTLSSCAELFGVGASVGAYLPNPIPEAASPVKGSAVATATVASDGSLTFAGLADDTRYVAYDAGSGRRRWFRTRSTSITSVLQVTQAQYNAIASPDPGTLYVIIG